MTNAHPPRRRGLAGVLLLLCTAFGAAGAGFDVLMDARPSFWLGVYPGAPAAIGAGAALLAVLAGRLAQLIAQRDGFENRKGGRGAGGHP